MLRYSLIAYYRMLSLLFLFAMSIQAPAETLYIGSIGDDPDEEIKEFNGLALYLEKHLKQEGVTQVKTVVSPNKDVMIELMKAGKVNLYIDSPFPSMIVSEKSGSTIFLRRWKKGVAEYHSVIFTRKDSGIHSTNDMLGYTIAFEDPFSTSSYFLPKSTLLKQGFSLQKITSGLSVDEGKIGYVFSNDDRNTMLWVIRKKVDLGAMNLSSFEKLSKKRRKDLEIIERSLSVPRHVVSYDATMSAKRIEKIKSILTQMHQSEEGRSVLEGFSKTSQFDEFPGGVESYMKPLQSLLQYQ